MERIPYIGQKFYNLFFGDSLSHLKKFYKKYGLIGILGLLIFAFTSYVVVITYVLGFIKSIFLDKYHYDYEKIDSIKLQYQLGYVVDLFGKPAIVNQTEEGYIESLFMGNGYILQVVTDTGNKINSIGIVCTSLDFNYNIAGIQLCKTHFEDLSDNLLPLNEAQGGASNKHQEYYESYGGDGVHGYKYYIFGFNSLGAGEIVGDLNKVGDIGFSGEKGLAFSGTEIKIIRRNSTINTYFISDTISDGKLTVNGRKRFGPDYYQLHYLTSIE